MSGVRATARICTGPWTTRAGIVTWPRACAALRRWIAGIADEVKTSGEERALEPMSPADRKVIHDAVNEIEGVETRSEGEDARRYVVLVPSD
ncbi:MAG: hypothetical protein EBU33_02080 [Sphingobacteriia bacterium]|nr:hypothetical protein [Sphingobacteriia bacterium]